MTACLATLAQQPAAKTKRRLPQQYPARDPCGALTLQYYPDDVGVNQQAQFLHGVRELRKAYNLSGGSATVGIWDAGHVLALHAEFGNRVILQDAGSTGVYVDAACDAHCGNCRRGGRTAAAQGMAPAAKMFSFYFEGDIAKLGKATQLGITVTNHSYGSVGGWDFDNESESKNECEVKWHWFGRDKDAGELSLWSLQSGSCRLRSGGV